MSRQAQVLLRFEVWTDYFMRTEKPKLTVKSWNTHGTTSLEGNGVLGLELLGEIGRPSSRLA